MKDQDEMFEAATETPAFMGCPSLGPKTLPGGFDGTGQDTSKGEATSSSLVEKAEIPSPTSGEDAASPLEKEELQKRGAKLFACNERMRERIVEIAHLANECLLNTNHPNGYEPGQYGRDYRTYGKAICEIRRTCKESMVDTAAPDYEWLAKIMTTKVFDPDQLAKAIEAEASKRPIDYPTFYTPGWLVRFAKEQLGKGEAASSQLTPEEQSDIDRALAREKLLIHWTCYPTKTDLAVMGKTKQNGKVYEVRIVKRTAEVTNTYWETKVNGHRVFQGWFEGSAWMAKRMLTAAMQALVNHKAKRARDRRRNFAKRARAAKQQAHDNKGAAATHS